MNIRLGIAYGMMVVWLLASCNSQTRYHQFRHINQGKWWQGDTVRFDIPLSDSLQRHELTLQLRHTSEYPYSDLAIGMQYFSPDSQLTRTTQYNIQLTAPKGYWIGSGQGGIYQLNIAQTILPPTSAGTWHVNVFHAMSDSILLGVHDVGIKISALPAGINTQKDK
jgi:gliding motility-associated lipoprotein GldH